MRYVRLGFILLISFLTNFGYAQVVDFTTISQTGTEHGVSFTATVQFDVAAAVDITVPFTLTGTATEGTNDTDDYTITATPLSILAGATTGDIVITVNDDVVIEGDETVIITLGTPSTGTLGTNIEHTLTITDNDNLPVASLVAVTGILEVGEILTGTYTYSDVDGDLEGTSTFRWLRDGVEIVGETAITYTLTITDDGTNISFEATPVALTGALIGLAVESPVVGPILPANTAPTATAVTVTGVLEVGEILTGNYTFTDADGDLEDVSTFRWLRDGVEIVGETAITYTLTATDDGTDISFEVTPVALTGVLIGVAVESPAVGPILPANTAPTATAVTVTGVLEVGEILTGNYTFTDADGDLEDVSTFRWLRDGVEIVGETAITYTLTATDDGTDISFEVTPVALTGVLIGVAVESPAVGPILPANTAPTATAVTVTGVLEVGEILTGNYTFTDADGDLEDVSTYRWLRDGVEIVGETAITYTLTATDDGTDISFEVTPVALTGVLIGVAVESPAVGPILPANTAPTATAVTVTGILEVGEILTGNYTFTDADGDLEDVSTYRWLRDGVEIVGETAITYTLTATDDGTDISFEVTPVALTGVLIGVAVESPAVGPILPANTAPTATAVTVTGTVEIGQILTGNYTFTDADGDLEDVSTYRWLRDGVAITGATAITYTLSVDDDGTDISFEVTPVALTGVLIGLAVESPTVGPVLPANTPPIATNVNITGITEVGEVLTGNHTYTDLDGDLEGISTFRWLRDGVEIVGATASTYTLIIDDEVTIVSFEVTPVALTGVLTGSAVESPGVGPIGAANTIPTATDVTITGILEVGEILTGNYTFTDADGDLEGVSTFRWLRDDIEIAGATLQTYTLTIDDDGSDIIFEVTPVALTGVLTGTAVQSPAVGPVLPANTAPTASAVTVTGVTEVGQILTGNYTYADADGDLEGVSTYRWLLDGIAIVGATAQTYTIAAVDDGANISFEVTPVALTGVLIGSAVESPTVGPVLPANTAPIATNVNITGVTEVGEVLTGNYTYTDLDGDLEGISTFRWLRDGVEIVGATASTYTLIIDDEATVISFEVTPVALTGVLTGSAVESPGVGPIGAANTIPAATDVTITGILEVGEILTGNYTYTDADGDLEGVSTFRWLRDDIAIAGATFQTYTLTIDDDGADIILEVTPVALTGVLTGTAVQSPAVGPILPANTAPTASAVTVTGVTEVGQILTGNYTYADADGDLEGVSTYRWLRDGVAITGATALTYTLLVADDGADIIFEVTPVALTGILIGTAVQSPSVGPILPENTAPTANTLTITGITEVGSLLTGSYTYVDADGDLEGVSTFRWLRDGVAITGATATTYTLTIADEGTIITFEVTPIALSGVLTGTAVESAGVGPIGAANSIPSATDVAISGITEEGETLTGNYTYSDLDGDLEGTTTYSWLRDGVVISGATDQTYVLTLTDVGTNIIFEVTPLALTGASPGSPVQSAEVGPILAANDPPTAIDLSVTGILEVGAILTGNYTYSDVDGDLEGVSTFRWLRDGLAIASATAQTYTLTVADEGANISFEVLPVALTGDSPGSPSQSAAVGPILPANTAPIATSVAITGTTEVGFNLTGSYTYSDVDGDLQGVTTFRWLRDNVAINGAITASYTLQTADQGTTITFEVTPVAVSGVSPGNPVLSSAVGPIGAANTIPSAIDVSISGIAEVGQVITGIYTYVDADGDVEGASTFRWLRDNTAIPGETGQTYTIAALDLGSTLTFEVTPVAAAGASPGSAVQSASLGPVVAANSVPIATAVSVAGTAEVGQQLNGIYTYADADGDPEGNSTFRWLRDGTAIAGATDQSYRLITDDLGTSIIFEVTPAALTGVSPGRAVQSASIGPVRDPDVQPISVQGVVLPQLHEANSGSETYTIEIGGDIAVERVLFIFKSLTAPRDGWVTRDLTSATNTYSITVTEEAFDEMGFEYEFVANDVEGNSANILGVTYIQYPDNGLDFESLVFGDEISNYNLISVPLDLDNAAISQVFEDDLGPYDQTQWRLFSHSSTGVLEYQSGLSSLERGSGYWLIVKDPSEIDTGTGTTIVAGDTEFSFSLVPGWNLIGNPYTFNVSWDDVLTANPVIEGLDAQLTVYNSGYQESSVLNTLQGAFVFSDQLASLTVPLEKDPSIQGGRIHKEKDISGAANSGWFISLGLKTSEYTNSLGGFGMQEDALESKDKYDRIRAPRFLEYLDLSFNHKEYFAPNFSRDIVPLASNKTWDFSVDSNTGSSVIELTWDNTTELAIEKELWLLHKETQRILNMRTQNSYSFDNTVENTFKVAYGQPEFVEDELIPTTANLAAVYPNPFIDNIRIEFALPKIAAAANFSLAVYDLNGKQVRVLVQGQQLPGFYNVVWDGTNSTGDAVSNGIYLLVMKVHGQKSIYRRVLKQ